MLGARNAAVKCHVLPSNRVDASHRPSQYCGSGGDIVQLVFHTIDNLDKTTPLLYVPSCYLFSVVLIQGA
jgi:hypothetical protein